MNQDDQFAFSKNWYELWLTQSKEFFASAEKNLAQMFNQNKPINPEDHMQQINEWIEDLKKQWQLAQLTSEQRAYQEYWQTLLKMSHDATDKMLQEWIKRFHEHQPIKTVRELYELWLNACHEIYQTSLRTKSYQEVYGNFMNAAFDFWKTR